MRNKLLYILLAALACLMLLGCGGRDNFTATDGSEGPLVIYPDYKDVTIPANIAPLNFRYAMADVRRARTTFTLGDKSVTIKGNEVEWRLGAWKAFWSVRPARRSRSKRRLSWTGNRSPTAGLSS